MTLEHLSAITSLLAVVSYLGLVVFCVLTILRGITGRALLFAATVTLTYLLAWTFLGQTLSTLALELLSLQLWIALLIRAIGVNGENWRDAELRAVSWLALASLATLVFGLAHLVFVSTSAPTTNVVDPRPHYLAEILLNIIGLVLIEQLSRNTREDLRPKLRYLNMGLGLIFAYGLFNSALGLMYSGQVLVLDVAQPLVFALAVPFLVVSSLRNRDNQLRFNVSRQFIFRSSILTAVGVGLLLIGAAGYALRQFGGDADVAALVLTSAVLLAVVLAIGGSDQVRARSRYFVTRHLFESAHDYRENWERVSRLLTEPDPDFSAEQQGIRSLLAFFDARGGALWQLNDSHFSLIATHHDTSFSPLDPTQQQLLLTLFAEDEDLIDLQKVQPAGTPEVEESLNQRMLAAGTRYLIPLRVQGELTGFISVQDSPFPRALSEEDRDIVSLVARQVAGVLAVRNLDRRLSESRQFESLNRMTTYLLHDVKTTVAQLNLTLENVERHRNNPAFIDDMIDTVANATQRMASLIRQIDRPDDGAVEQQETVMLSGLLDEVIDRFKSRAPRPALSKANCDACIKANRERLDHCLEHLISNAVEATDPAGDVSVTLERNGTWVDVRVADSGSGMTAEFISEELFQPFRSTKGVTGMGIGAHQVREYVRRLGGDVLVESEPGNGSIFTLKLPAQP